MLSNTLLQKYGTSLALLLIVVISGILRLYGLDNQSLWNDELATWVQSTYSDLAEVFKEGIRHDVHPPGYVLLSFYLVKLFGDTEFILRLPSAIAGVLSTFGMFLLGRRLYSHREGLISAGFMAVLLCPISYSQEARSYSLLMMCVIFGAYFWLDILKNPRLPSHSKKASALAYIAFSATACYLHHFGSLLVFLQYIFSITALLQSKSNTTKIHTVNLAIFFIYTPWLKDFFIQISSGYASWIPLPQQDVFFELIKFYFNYNDPLSKYIILAYIGLALYAFIEFKKNKSKVSLAEQPTLILFLWFIIPFTLTILITFSIKPIYVERYLLICLPAVYILLARAITQVPLPKLITNLAAVVFIGYLLHNLLYSLQYYATPKKGQFREAANFIAQNENSYPGAVTLGFAWKQQYLNYYLDKKNADQRAELNLGLPEDIPTASDYIQSKNPQYIWYFAALRTPSGEFMGYINDDYSLVLHEQFIEADIWLFKKKPLQPKLLSRE